MREIAIEFSEERERSEASTSDMKKNYLDMQAHYKVIIENFLKEVQEMKIRIDNKHREIEETRRAKDQEIQQKIDETHHLQAQMEGMAVAFADMLKDVLDRMNQRVEVTQHAYDMEGARLPLLSRLKDFTLLEKEHDKGKTSGMSRTGREAREDGADNDDGHAHHNESRDSPIEAEDLRSAGSGVEIGADDDGGLTA
uniref:Coiled-coil domain-containing protein 153 n=1 Tax=Chromera velia CCMP2878 TaxID=1169474 RepID=A0A0G4H7T1_9ALVE|eukprot:Cvel_5849.t1-p1 / transcript=Cvel_5849.t1 / gene=Cvel_5849 / organism=Chromera_velia_CCMP2878 / gene_product=hypothetical protein / transcript_product=hypothetical protein / location=Cvel_scaffold278:27734-29769(+) / protein_length=196 / sequence_SO=supercontig / SO=protein_coding / is_pseudo=false